MQIIRGYENAPAAARGTSAALGNFDGVHKGHLAVVEAARRHRDSLAVVTFEPHPRQFFSPESPAFRLTPDPAKARLLAQDGVETLFILPFDAALAAMSGEAFAREVLGEALGLTHVAVGEDFRFGAGRGGDVAGLSKWGAAAGFGVTTVSPVSDPDGQPYSSSRARRHLREGEPRGAAEVLGRFHTIEGAVSSGDQRGRTIGFATANLSLEGVLSPRFGVYAISAEVVEGPHAGRYAGVANLGLRPTFGGETPILEAHLFDFAGNIYGVELRVALIEFLRPEQRFSGIDALKDQIGLDVKRAQKIMAAET